MTKRATNNRLLYRFALVTLGPALVAAGGLWLAGLDPVLAWLLSITIFTVLTYGYDKAIAGSRRTRVPEKVLLLLALLGGTLGALAGMEIFRHKTDKASFQRKLVAIVAVQVILIAAYLYLRYWS